MSNLGKNENEEEQGVKKLLVLAVLRVKEVEK